MISAPKKRLIKKKVSSIIYDIIIIFLLIMTVIFILDRINHRATFIFEHTILIIATGSMEPEIPTDSCILLEQVEPKDIKIGDVITFYSDDPSILGSMNTHRVVGITAEQHGVEFITKGDNNLLEDTYRAKGDNLVGRYIKVLPVMTVITSFLMSEIGFLVIILSFISYIAVIFIRAYFKKRKISVKEKEADINRKIAEEVERLKVESSKDSSENK